MLKHYKQGHLPVQNPVISLPPISSSNNMNVNSTETHSNNFVNAMDGISTIPSNSKPD